MNAFYPRFGKRIFDFTSALIGLLFLLPLLIVVALLIKLTSRGPVFFRQVRTGRHDQPFRIWKFRSMTVRESDQGPLITAAQDDRVTTLGRWLRKTKCDELPQLMNVVSGEMSLVGPRPEVPLYTRTYSPQQKRVLKVRPGITGPSSNMFISEEEVLAKQADKEKYYLTVILPAKLKIDLAYCRKITFNTDLKLIANTFTSLLFKYRSSRSLLQNSQFRRL